MTLKYLIQKEFLQIRRNAFLPKLIVMFPIVIMCVMPWVMQMEVKNIVVDVVDIDHTMESQRVVQKIAASNYFIFGGQKATYAEAMKDIEKGRADVILENGQRLSESDSSRIFLFPPSSFLDNHPLQQGPELQTLHDSGPLCHCDDADDGLPAHT